MDHLERTLVEILRRTNDLERSVRAATKVQKNIVGTSNRTNVAYANDHRFL